VTGRVTEDSTARRLELGLALKKARREAKLTQSAVAERLRCTQGKINKIETTLVTVSDADLEQMIEIYGLPAEEAGRLRELAGQGRPDASLSRTAPANAWSAFGQLSHYEPDASEILAWHSERIPGPLQSEQYMLQQYAATNIRSGVTALVRQRKARAGIFTIENPPHYRAILSESSLLRMPGGLNPRLAVDQAEHLLQLMRLHEHVTVQILLFGAKAQFVDTDFEVLRFSGGAGDFAYVEFPGGARTFKSARELKAFEQHWLQLHESALDRAETMAFLDDMSNK
jgi:transcriptional regulator with XRE-family HTH domain